jgi:hypothetical protein
MWWILTTIFAVSALFFWRKSSLLHENKSQQFTITKQQIHQIKNDLTSVCISLEGLSMTGKNSMPVEQFDVITAATEYATRLKRTVCELLELEAIQNKQSVSVRETKTKLSDIINYREFHCFAESIKQVAISQYGPELVFNVDRVKLLQVVESFVYSIKDHFQSVSFSTNFTKSDNNVIGELIAEFNLNDNTLEFESSLSYQFVNKISDAIGLQSHFSFDNNQAIWKLVLPLLYLEQKNEQILVVSHSTDSHIPDITKAMGRVVTSVNGIEEALCAIQQNCYKTIIFDGSKELGQQLALAKIMRHDLHLASKTVLISPEKTVNSQLASEFGIDSVMNADQLKTYSI